MMLSISESDPLFGVIKAGYVKRGNRLPNYAGHAVVLINDTVWDITSEQFGLPNIYPFEDLFKWWDKVAISDITLSDDEFSFYVKEVITKRVLRSPNDVIGMEGMRPRFLEW